MSKSRARLLAELLNSAGRVKKDKSDLAGADSIIDLDTLPTITNAKLENSSISIAGHSTALGGSVSLNTGDITEHTDYKYYTDARVRAAVSAGGNLSYNSSTGVFSYTTPTTIASLSNHDTADLAEGTNLYYTDTRARSAISVSGDLAYNSTTGVVSFTERTDAEVRGLVSAGGNLSYNSSTGVFSYTTPTTIASLSNHDTDDLAEGTNLYFTNARARSAISVSGNAISYNSSTGVISSSYEESPTFTGNVTVSGNLTVSGTTTTIDTANLNVEDKNITLNYSTGDSSSTADGAGITIQDAVSSTTDASMTWNASNDVFDFSHGIQPSFLYLEDQNGSVSSLFGIYGWDDELQFTKRNLSTRAHTTTLLALDYSTNQATFAAQVNVSGHGNSSQWNTAYGWGDHSTAGYNNASNLSSGTLPDARLGSGVWRNRGNLNVTTASGGSNNNPFDDAHTETKVATNGNYSVTYTGASAHLISSYAGGSASVFQIGAHYNGDDFYMRVRTDGSSWKDWRKLFHDNYHPNADKWTTARTLSLTGAVTGSVSVDGSANASIATTAGIQVPRTFSLPQTGSSNNQWMYIGRATSLAQHGASVSLRLRLNSGYNASNAQNVEAYIRFKTSNSSSDQSGFYGDAQLYRFGQNTAAIQQLKVVQASTSEYRFYILVSQYSGDNSNYTVEQSSGAWTHVGTYGSTAPTGTLITESPRRIFTSGFAQNDNLDLGTGTATANGFNIGANNVISSTRAITGTYFTDGYVTWNAAQFNRSGAYIELQWSPVNSSAGVRIGGNGSNPIVFDAYNGTISSNAITASGSSVFNPTSDMIIVNEPSTNTDLQTIMRVGTESGGLYLTGNNAIIGKGAYYDGGWIATATTGSQIDFTANDRITFSTFSGATVGGTAAHGSRAYIHAGGLNVTDEISAATLRLTGTGDAALSSTTHALQIGPSNGTNIIMDVNEIMARSNGSESSIHMNADGGNITFRNNGGGTTNLVMSGQVFLDHSRNLMNIANIGATSGHVSGKFAVKSTGVHASYDFYNNGTSYFNGAVTVDDTLYISGTNGRIRFGNTEVIDPNRVLKNITRAEFANMTVTGTSTTAPSMVRYANIAANPEGSHMSHPYLFNDLANFVARGGSIAVGGLNTTPSFTNCFKANGQFASWSNSNYSGSTMTITLTSLPHGLSYGGYIGIAFGNTSWCPSSCKIEISTDGGSTWTTRLNDTSAKEIYFTTTGTGGTPANAIRFTLGQAANTTSIRVTNIWAYNYNTQGMENYFLSKAGGTVYGNVTLSGTLSSGAITSTGTSSFASLRLTDASRLGFGTVKSTGSVNHTASVDEGIFWHVDSSYGIYRTSGAWSSPDYQQLRLKWITGIELDGGTAYGKSGVKVIGGPFSVNAVNNTYNFKAFGQDTDSWFGVYDDANNSANIILTRSDGATIFSVMGHTGATTIAGTLSSETINIGSGHVLTLPASHTKQKIGLFGGVGVGAEWIGTSANTLELSGTNINLNGASGSGTPTLKMADTTVIDSNRRLYVSNGTAAAPSISFSADQNTGFYHYTTDQIGFAIAGSHRGTIDNDALRHFGRETQLNEKEVMRSSALAGPNNTTQRHRRTILEVSYNTHHWMSVGVFKIKVEQTYPIGADYAEYLLHLGYLHTNGSGSQGGSGSNVNDFVLTRVYSSKAASNYDHEIVVGTPTDTGYDSGEYDIYKVPIYLENDHYSQHRVTIEAPRDTFSRVSSFTGQNQFIFMPSYTATVLTGQVTNPLPNNQAYYGVLRGYTKYDKSTTLEDGSAYYVQPSETATCADLAGRLKLRGTSFAPNPDAYTYLSASELQFGGNNNGLESNSGQISVSQHQGSSFNFVGVGTSQSNRRMDFWCEGGAYFRGNVTVTGNVTAYGSASDERLKTNIVKIENPIAKLQSVSGYKFDWNENAPEDKQGLTEYGVIAQEVEKAGLNELVFEYERPVNETGGDDTSAEQWKAVHYEKFVPILIEAVKEQSAQIDAQQEQINELTNLVNALMEK